MPPRMITGVARPGSAARIESRISAPVARTGLRMSQQRQTTRMISSSSSTNPGITPAAKVCDTGTWVSAL